MKLNHLFLNLYFICVALVLMSIAATYKFETEIGKSCFEKIEDKDKNNTELVKVVFRRCMMGFFNSKIKGISLLN